MEKKSLFNILCPFRLSAKNIVIVLWLCVSLAMLSVADDAPLWFILLDCVNFALAAYCLKYININDDEA